MVLGIVAFSPKTPAQSLAPRTLLESAAAAMGGLDRIRALENIVMTGFGQRYNTNGNLSPDANSPAKWVAIADAERTFDLRNRRALNQERQGRMFPFASSAGSWTRSNTLQTGRAALDHPVPALLAALAPDTAHGPVRIEKGLSVIEFTIAAGTTLWMAFDPATNLPAWVRWIAADSQLGDLTHTAYFTGYLPFDGVRLPIGLMNRIDWRDQITFMFQVDSYRVNAKSLPPFPQGPAGGLGGGGAAAPASVNEIAKGVWDVRVGRNGGPVIEFENRLVIFEPVGSEAQFFARLDAANKLVAGKQVDAVIVTHHHSDHAAAIRGAVARGLTIIAERGNEALYREFVSRPAVSFPDALARNPRPMVFMPVDGRLILEDRRQRLEIYYVVEHLHMSNAVFAYLPNEKILMEGDLSDVSWDWHWWAGALSANIKRYGLDPALNVPVHGAPLGMEETLARMQEQVSAAQAFCKQNVAAGIHFFGCPVQYTPSGHVRNE
jgi:hypothetical protein